MTPSLGVVGAGTMGAGIAQLGAQAGWETLVHDPVADHDSEAGTSISLEAHESHVVSPVSARAALARVGT